MGKEGIRLALKQLARELKTSKTIFSSCLCFFYLAHCLVQMAFEFYV